MGQVRTKSENSSLAPFSCQTPDDRTKILATRDIIETWEIASESFRQGERKHALAELLEAAERGEWVAYCEIGHLYEMGGGGVERNLEKAVSWYRRSVFEAGDPHAHLGLARLHFKGEGVERDYEKSLFHARKALVASGAVQLNERYRVMAYVMLATIYGEGLVSPRDREKAKALLNEAAAEGYVWPVYLLANMELKACRLLRWFALRMKAARMVVKLSKTNPDDPRLEGCRRLPARLVS